jgi:hypothetical protein
VAYSGKKTSRPSNFAYQLKNGLYSKTGPIGKARNQEVATHVQPLRGPAKAALVSGIAKKRATFLKGTGLVIYQPF